MERKDIPLYMKCAAGTAVNACIAPSNSTEKWRVVAMSESPNAAITANDTDYVTLTPTNGSASVATARTTQATGGAGRAVGTPVNWTLVANKESLEITQAAPFKMAITHSGAGKAVDTNLILTVDVIKGG